MYLLLIPVNKLLVLFFKVVNKYTDLQRKVKVIMNKNLFYTRLHNNFNLNI